MGIFDSLFKGKAHEEVIHDIVNNLGHLAECELEISEFYKLCADSVEEDRGFWETLVKAEVRHAEQVRKMVELIQASPKEYRPGQKFNPAAIRTFKTQIEGLIHDLRKGKIGSDRLFTIAGDIEDSAMELEFAKIVESENEEFKALAKQIDADCVAHKTAIQNKAAQQG